jgi:hypothetical protein
MSIFAYKNGFIKFLWMSTYFYQNKRRHIPIDKNFQAQGNLQIIYFTLKIVMFLDPILMRISIVWKLKSVVSSFIPGHLFEQRQVEIVCCNAKDIGDE